MHSNDMPNMQFYKYAIFIMLIMRRSIDFRKQIMKYQKII